MKTSESILKIIPALLKAQRTMGAATKASSNPFYKSTYADIGEVMKVCKDPLNENNILVIQPVGHDELGEYVETVLIHESGEFISDRMHINATSKPQEQGSAITYARRYGLQSMLFIPAEDDDGNAASKQPAQAKKKEEVKPAQPSEQGAPASKSAPSNTSGEKMASESQIKWIKAAKEKGQITLTDEEIDALTFQGAVDAIGEIRKALGK